MDRSITRAKMGPAPLIPETPCMGVPSKFPAQIATVRSAVKPTVQLSTKARLVPVLAATGKGRRSALSIPNAGARAGSSARRSVSRATAGAGRNRPGATSATGATGRPDASRAARISTSGSSRPPRASPR